MRSSDGRESREAGGDRHGDDPAGADPSVPRSGPSRRQWSESGESRPAWTSSTSGPAPTPTARPDSSHGRLRGAHGRRSGQESPEGCEHTGHERETVPRWYCYSEGPGAPAPDAPEGDAPDAEGVSVPADEVRRGRLSDLPCEAPTWRARPPGVDGSNTDACHDCERATSGTAPAPIPDGLMIVSAVAGIKESYRGNCSGELVSGREYRTITILGFYHSYLYLVLMTMAAFER